MDEIPGALIGSLRSAVSFATDALQFSRPREPRRGEPPDGIIAELARPALAARALHGGAARCAAAPRARRESHAGFFGCLRRASSGRHFRSGSVQAQSMRTGAARGGASGARRRTRPSPTRAQTLCSAAAPLQAADLDAGALERLFPQPWRHEELDERAGCCRSSTAPTVTWCCGPRSCACCGRTASCCAPGVI